MFNMANGMGSSAMANKFFSRMFRPADGVVWDLMSGKIGVLTEDGIATLEGEGDDAVVNCNMFEDFGVAIPAFAQSTPVADVKVGDIIVRGAKDNISWVVSKNEDKGTFKLMKPSGDLVSFNPPKVQMFGLEGGIMVLRSLMTMLPGGTAGLGGIQSMLLPMIQMSAMTGQEMDLSSMMPMILFSTMQGAGGAGAAGGMGGAMQAMMMMPLLQKMMGGEGAAGGMGSAKPLLGNKNSGFDRNGRF